MVEFYQVSTLVMGGTHDFLNKINIATSYSDDNGNSWTKPKLTLSFDDFESVPLEWPRDPGKRDWQISGGATYIDSVLLEKRINRLCFLLMLCLQELALGRL